MLISKINPQVNREIVKIQRVSAPVGQMQLKSLIESHVVSTPIYTNKNLCMCNHVGRILFLVLEFDIS